MIKRTELKELFYELKIGAIGLLKNKFFYLGLAILLIGVIGNYLSDGYLNKCLCSGEIPPTLSDLILDNIPYLNVSFLYDWLAFVSVIFFAFYVFLYKEYENLPYYFLVLGLFEILRATFVVLTPFGHPTNFAGSTSIFHGFTRYDLGLYPSGHTGLNFMYLFLSKGFPKLILLILSLGIVFSLFLSRGHYSIDILSGIIFAYAVYSLGERHLKKRFR
jgi:membrane-associated phospholipid phosphatase